jgi:hypothetical protein
LIFIGISRLVAKGLKHDKDENKNDPIQYPCSIANIFECHYENGKRSDTRFDVEDLFELANITFAVEIALAVVIEDKFGIQIKNKPDLYRALTDGETFNRILEQGWNYMLSSSLKFCPFVSFQNLVLV